MAMFHSLQGLIATCVVKSCKTQVRVASLDALKVISTVSPTYINGCIPYLSGCHFSGLARSRQKDELPITK